nr:MAG TPA: hypothetical protein [Caudoviricetes sp.]
MALSPAYVSKILANPIKSREIEYSTVGKVN